MVSFMRYSQQVMKNVNTIEAEILEVAVVLLLVGNQFGIVPNLVCATFCWFVTACDHFFHLKEFFLLDVVKRVK